MSKTDVVHGKFQFVFKIFLVIEKLFRPVMKRKIDFKQMVYSLLISIQPHFAASQNTAREKPEDDISPSLLDSMLTFYLRVRTCKCLSFQ